MVLQLHPWRGIRTFGQRVGQIVSTISFKRGARRRAQAADTAPPAVASKPAIVEGSDEQGLLVQRFLDQGRSAILLRPAIAATIAEPHLAAVRQRLRQEMAWTAAGDVQLTDWSYTVDECRGEPTHREHVEAFHLDRHPVTNRRFREFISNGGYTQEVVWDAEIWPRVAELVDRTGAPGPRFWSKGRFADGTEDWPVIGVSWFEADAFARWAGKRLPTDAEWVKVAACPSAGQGSVIQRRFPWGDELDPARTNLWISGLERPSPVDQFCSGASANGVVQLVGNVWEWTTSDLRISIYGKDSRFEPALKSLRGGAFDTYFEHQATCQLHSGDVPLARRHNVGFRCALSVGPADRMEAAP